LARSPASERLRICLALQALKAYDVGKPLVVEEMFPLKCMPDELADFVTRSSDDVEGWISFYWGQMAEELRSVENATLGQSITASWLEAFERLAAKLTTPAE